MKQNYERQEAAHAARKAVVVFDDPTQDPKVEQNLLAEVEDHDAPIEHEAVDEEQHN